VSCPPINRQGTDAYKVAIADSISQCEENQHCPALEGLHTITNLLYLEYTNNMPDNESWWLREIMGEPGDHVAVTCIPTSSDSLRVAVSCVRRLIQEECSGFLEGVGDMGTQPYGWSRCGFISLFGWSRCGFLSLK
jgi:hypothetical protein